MRRIIVVGSGFAGLWAAIGAARARAERGCEGEIEILVLTRQPYHGIRVRFYESDLSNVTIPLEKLLTPVGVPFRVGDVVSIDAAASQVRFATGGTEDALAYDRLVLASGSALPSPCFAGGGAVFDVDTFGAATALAAHISGLGRDGRTADGTFAAVVIGGGFTGIEVASELIGRMRQRAAAFDDGGAARVVLVDHGAVGASLGTAPQPKIREALAALGVECREQAGVAAIAPDAVVLASGERIQARTVVATTGMRASPLAAAMVARLDPLGRVAVDPFLRVASFPRCFAAGDVARAMVDDVHPSVMSCQHARPQGRIAGHNVVADLLGQPLIAYRQEAYVTVLDLGAWGALYMEGWERRVLTEGAAAKQTKGEINHRRIYPPFDGGAEALIAAAAPIIQTVPTVYKKP
jgi:NADH dehydrogenase, FAD-containing subunit